MRCKRIAAVAAALCLALGLLPAVAEGELPALVTFEDRLSCEGTTHFDAIYLGVDGYGTEAVNKDAKADFKYRFSVGGREVLFGIDPGAPDADGTYVYPIQNLLKEGYGYRIEARGDTVVSAEELPQADEIDFTPVVSGVPGERTLGNFLKTAMEPVGTTLYIYGDGWDWQDVGAAVQARTLGVSGDWVRFFEQQDERYTFKSRDGNEDNADPTTSYFPYGGYNEYYYAGLDCSGYMGWVLYNTFETRDGEEGYVISSSRYARALAERGFGSFTQALDAPMKPGDVVSIGGHVWISLGTCADGSAVALHSTAADSRAGQPGGGVELSAIGPSEDCEAYRLADRYMSAHYPKWYARYPIKLCDPEVYFAFTDEKHGRFTWDTVGGALSDPEGVGDMTAAQVLAYLFGE